MDIRKINSMHYRLLRIVKWDWKQKKKRHELDSIGRARPTLWAKYAAANTVIKILRDGIQIRLQKHLAETCYHERRHATKIKFYDKSTNRHGMHAIGNRLGHVFSELNETFNLEETDHVLRTKLKSGLNFTNLD